jgi:uroporphyrinogen decarboxylase
VQPECIDPVWLKREYGRDIVLHGGGSVQRTLPFGTPADCRAEANRLVEECGYDGGLVIRASNAISFDCPLENILAFFETVRDHQ